MGRVSYGTVQDAVMLQGICMVSASQNKSHSFEFESVAINDQDPGLGQDRVRR